MTLLFIGDELLSDSFPYKEIENGALWEVEGKVRLSPFSTSVVFVVLMSLFICLFVLFSLHDY